jgi:hypothetical protein
MAKSRSVFSQASSLGSHTRTQNKRQQSKLTLGRGVYGQPQGNSDDQDFGMILLFKESPQWDVFARGGCLGNFPL